jgi:hypothetical protein
MFITNTKGFLLTMKLIPQILFRRGVDFIFFYSFLFFVSNDSKTLPVVWRKRWLRDAGRNPLACLVCALYFRLESAK